ncbi:hypothetical protein F5141DRAFT_614715 [Pisolithus sp. B1]|nr:hypothetical protein F5141DRAFT_614715 [Pisolithus sp. B1]
MVKCGMFVDGELAVRLGGPSTTGKKRLPEKNQWVLPSRRGDQRKNIQKDWRCCRPRHRCSFCKLSCPPIEAVVSVICGVRLGVSRPAPLRQFQPKHFGYTGISWNDCLCSGLHSSKPLGHSERHSPRILGGLRRTHQIFCSRQKLLVDHLDAMAHVSILNIRKGVAAILSSSGWKASCQIPRWKDSNDFTVKDRRHWFIAEL